MEMIVKARNEKRLGELLNDKKITEDYAKLMCKHHDLCWTMIDYWRGLAK